MTRTPCFLLAVAIALAPVVASAQTEPASCLLEDSRQFPLPSRPYVLIIADTSASMTSPVGTPSSCGTTSYGSDRRAHQRCAIRNAIRTYSGIANFGLMTYALRQTGCSATCYAACAYGNFPGESASTVGCGPGSGPTRRGGFLQVPVLQDAFWTAPPLPDNTAALDTWTDNDCSNGTELFAGPGGAIPAGSPLNGALRDALRYFSSSWTAQDNSVTLPTPFAAQDLGSGTACRRARVVLIADGGDTCDAATDAQSVAAALASGVNVGGKTFRVLVDVISFGGGSAAELDAIAAAGGTGAAVTVNNETEMLEALGMIVQSVAPAEQCDNVDNDCNGCTDEGFDHFGNVGQTCCDWVTPAQRATCLNTFFASISPAVPLGDRTKIPCASAAQAIAPATWSCYDPGEICDGQDNNLDGEIDEGLRKCGSPPQCPTDEVCNGKDDDCDGLVDEGACAAPPGVALPEICNGCDDDLDGLVDEGAAAVACGTSNPPNCAGTQLCKPPVPVSPGGCAPGAGFAACGNSPEPETCDGLDNDCNGLVDDGIPPVACTPPGTPGDLVYGGTSQCTRGAQGCGGACVGFVGPTGEVSDGVDNDCDGVVDNLFQFRDGFE